MKKFFSDPTVDIYNLNANDVITASDGLTSSNASDDGYGEIIDFDLGL